MSSRNRATIIHLHEKEERRMIGSGSVIASGWIGTDRREGVKTFPV